MLYDVQIKRFEFVTIESKDHREEGGNCPCAYLLKVKIISESCKDIPPDTDCAHCKSHVLVNGRQHSLNMRGIDIVLFDFRSGLFEHRMNYDVGGSTVHQDNLATFLNNLPPGKILFMSAKDAVNMNSGLALALQKIGVSATFATAPVPNVNMSLAYVGYTGQVRKDWEKSVNKIGGSGASIIEVNIKTFHERDGIDDCSNELGVRTRKIPDSRFYARTSWNNDIGHMPHIARLHSSKPGWCSGTYVPVSEYLQVDLGTRKILNGVAIQGQGIDGRHRISKFKIEYSNDGINWEFYNRGLSSAVELDGLQGEHTDQFETKVNWLQNIQMRFIRVVPTARATDYSTCLRMELFGCSISRSFVSVELWPSSSMFVNDIFTGTISLFGTITKNMSVHISTAPDFSSLATSNDQFHFRRINASTTVDNGTVIMDNGEMNLLTDWTRKFDNEALIQFGLKGDIYYAFEVDFVGKVVDAAHPMGNTFLTITTETEAGILAYSTTFQIKRSTTDSSNLRFNLTTFNLDNLVENSYLYLNLSISHLLGKSNSNAYGVTLMIYFNTKFLQLKSLAFVNTSRFSLPPSRNTTTPGFIMIQTDTLWLLNRQEFSIILQAKYPKSITRGENCNEDIIIDFAYKNNLAKFNGTANSTLERNVDLGTRKILNGVAIQGQGIDGRHRISKFKIEYSNDGINWEFYNRGLSSAVELDGLQGEHTDQFETKVNWLQNIQMRFIRVVPTARASDYSTCLRMELFGCSISKGFVSVELSPSSSMFVNDIFTGKISLFGTITKNMSVHISTAPDFSSLATSNDQFHFRRINASTTVDNGTVIMDNGEMNLLTDWTRKIDNEALIQFGLKGDIYYAFEVDFVGKVVDAAHPMGNTFLIITTETEAGILAYSTTYQIKRSKTDSSNLQFNLTTFNLDNLVENSYLNLNLSISHLLGKSNSNAYGVTLMIYFNTKFLQLKSLAFLNTSRFSLPPSRNTTTPGFIMIQTDTMWLLNRQEFSIILQAKYPKSITRGENCNEDIIIDFAYKNNLAKFNGTANSTLERNVPFKCKINHNRDIRVKSVRLPSPAFSMIYDEVNQQFFFCYQNKTHTTRDSATCFFTEKQNEFWRQLPYVSSLMGVDVEKKTVYGLSRFGISYAISYYPYSVFDQMEDSEWTQVKDQGQIRKALKAASVDLLPWSPESSWIINESGQAIWAATKRGISKKVDGVWKRKVAFDEFI
eukprot:gene10284-18981_t